MHSSSRTSSTSSLAASRSVSSPPSRHGMRRLLSPHVLCRAGCRHQLALRVVQAHCALGRHHNVPGPAEPPRTRDQAALPRERSEGATTFLVSSCPANAADRATHQDCPSSRSASRTRRAASTWFVHRSLRALPQSPSQPGVPRRSCARERDEGPPCVERRRARLGGHAPRLELRTRSTTSSRSTLPPPRFDENNPNFVDSLT